MEKNVYLFVCEKLADWEAGLATALLSDTYTIIPKLHSYPVVTFGLSRDPVRSFGGLSITPDTDLSGVNPGNAAMVILPGSPLYEEHDPIELVPVLQECVRRQVLIAAVCGGTLFLARHGFLDSVRHTSCGPGWLKQHAPGYTGGDFYDPMPCVSDKGIITANPLGFVEFARAVHEKLDVFPPGFSEQLYEVIKMGYMDLGRYG